MILAIDPGACSGWAYRDKGGELHSCHLALDTERGLRAADELVRTIGLDWIVIEGMGYLPTGKARYDTAYGMGRHAGTWETLARLRGLPVAWVHPSEWQRAMLHSGRSNPGRAALKKLSVSVASKLAGHPVTVDEADAICLLQYETTEARLRR